MSRPSAGFRAARRCYGHLAGIAGVELRRCLEAAGLLEMGEGAFRLTVAGRAWAEALGLDGDDRDPARHARACLDGTEREWHVGGRLGRSILDRLLAEGAATPGPGREVQLAGAVRVAAALNLPPAGRAACR